MEQRQVHQIAVMLTIHTKSGCLGFGETVVKLYNFNNYELVGPFWVGIFARYVICISVSE